MSIKNCNNNVEASPTNLLESERVYSECSFNFGGFYYSLHDQVLESHFEFIKEYDEESEEKSFQEDNIDYDLARKTYSKSLVDWTNAETGMELVMESLYSPRFYNFETDRIWVKFSNHDYNKLSEYLMENADSFIIKYYGQEIKLSSEKELCQTVVDSILKYKCTSRDGYIALQKYEDIEHRMEYRMEALLEILVKYLDYTDGWNYSLILENVEF